MPVKVNTYHSPPSPWHKTKFLRAKLNCWKRICMNLVIHVQNSRPDRHNSPKRTSDRLSQLERCSVYDQWLTVRASQVPECPSWHWSLPHVSVHARRGVRAVWTATWTSPPKVSGVNRHCGMPFLCLLEFKENGRNVFITVNKFVCFVLRRVTGVRFCHCQSRARGLGWGGGGVQRLV